MTFCREFDVLTGAVESGARLFAVRGPRFGSGPDEGTRSELAADGVDCGAAKHLDGGGMKPGLARCAWLMTGFGVGGPRGDGPVDARCAEFSAGKGGGAREGGSGGGRISDLDVMSTSLSAASRLKLGIPAMGVSGAGRALGVDSAEADASGSLYATSSSTTFSFTWLSCRAVNTCSSPVVMSFPRLSSAPRCDAAALR